MGQVKRSGGRRLAYVLSEAMLREWWALIESTGVANPRRERRIFLYVDSIDKTVLRPTSMDEVLGLSNGGGRRIEEIRLSTSSDFDPTVFVRFGSSRHADSVWWSIEGDEDAVAALEGKFVHLVDRMRLSTTWLAYPSVWFFLARFVFACALIEFVIWRAPKLADTAGAVAVATYFGGTVAAVFLLGVLFDRAMRWLFPVAVFAWGDQAAHTGVLEKRRGVVLGSIGLTLVLGAAGGVLFG